MTVHVDIILNHLNESCDRLEKKASNVKSLPETERHQRKAVRMFMELSRGEQLTFLDRLRKTTYARET